MEKAVFGVSMFVLAFGLSACGKQSTQINGAGSTAIYPVLAKWAEAYKAKTGIAINYQSIGSGGGIAQIKAGTVDFGATDKPLTPEELDKDKLAQFPGVIIGIEPVVNVPGISAGQMVFNGKLLADIYMGKITKWDDPALKALNPRLKLPDSRISVVHRSDGSGTTFNFTDYLSKVSPEWKGKVGEGTAVNWPVGVGGKGNEGVAAYVKQIKGGIGYVEYAYAKQNQMSYGLMENAAGKVVHPDDATFQAAAVNADWTKTRDFFLILTNQPGAQSWPITGTTWLLLRKDAAPQKNKAVMNFADWFLSNGQQIAKQLDYVPMPAPTVKQIKQYGKTELKM